MRDDLSAVADALVVGGIPAGLLAIANYAAGIDLPPLASWQGIAAIKFVVVLGASDIAYFSLRPRARRTVVRWVAVFVAVSVLSWYLYNVGAGLPENAGKPLTWNSTLVLLYLTFFGAYGAAFGSIYATARRARSSR